MFIEPETNDDKPRLCSELDDAEKLRAFKLFLQGKFSIYKGFKYGLNLDWEHKKMVLKDLSGNVIWKDETGLKKHLTRDEFIEISKITTIGEFERQYILRATNGKKDSYCVSPHTDWWSMAYVNHVLIKDENDQPVCIAPPDCCGTYKWDMLPQVLSSDPDLLRYFFSIDPFGVPFHAIPDFGVRYVNFVLQECLRDDSLNNYTVPFLCKLSPRNFYDLVILRLNSDMDSGEDGTQSLSLEVNKKILGLLISEAPIGPEGASYKGGIFAKATDQLNVSPMESDLIRDCYLLIRGLDGDVGDMAKTDFSQALQQAENQMVKLCSNAALMFSMVSKQFSDSIRELINVSQKNERLSWCGDEKFFFEKLIEGLIDQYRIKQGSQAWIISAYKDLFNLSDKDKLKLRQLRPDLLRMLEGFVAYTLCNPQTNPRGHKDCRRQIGWDDKCREPLCHGCLDKTGKVCNPVQDVKDTEEATERLQKDMHNKAQAARRAQRLKIYIVLSVIGAAVVYLIYQVYPSRGDPKMTFSSLAAPARGRGVLK